jgi:sugar (pentulose or hexulose) kinase
MVSRVDTIHAAGGAAINREILQVMADVFGTRVFQMPVGNSAALGTALRAAYSCGQCWMRSGVARGRTACRAAGVEPWRSFNGLARR